MTKFCLASYQWSPRFSIKVIILGTMEFRRLWWNQEWNIKNRSENGQYFILIWGLIVRKDPSKSPWAVNNPKGRNWKTKTLIRSPSWMQKGGVLVVRPGQGNAVEGMGDVSRTPPHGPRNGTDNAFDRSILNLGTLRWRLSLDRSITGCKKPLKTYFQIF